MKVLMLNTRYAPESEAGPAFAVQSLAEALVALGHEVHVLCLARELQTSREVRGGVTVHRAPPGASKARALAMAADLVREERPDVVHTHWLSGFPLAELGVAIKQAGIRLVHTLHEYRFLCANGTLYRPDQGACERLCLECAPTRLTSTAFTRHVDGVVAVSRFNLNLHLRAGFFEHADTNEVIGTGYRGPDAPVERANESDRLNLGYLGRISPEKGIGWLASQIAGSALVDRLELTIAGRPPEGLRERWARSMPQLKVNWLGFVRPAELMKRIHWLVAPSLCYDAFPRSVLEAFAFGVPVLGSRMGGIPEMISHGHAGRLFDPRKDGSVLEEIRWIDDNRDHWESYRKAAWDSRTAFLPEKIAVRHLEIYNPPAPDGEGV